MKNHLLLTALLSASTILSAVSPALVSPVDIERIAKQTTVEITKCGSGSGAIVQKNGNTYSVLTVADVVKSSGCELVAPDNTRYQVTQVKAFPNNIDLAVVSFNSSQNYPVAKLTDNSDRVAAGAPLYVSGLPVSSSAVNSFVKGEVVANPPQQQQGKGYSLIYSTNRKISPGHSGSPIWNDRGELIAIQGQGDLQRQVAMNTDVRVNTGYSLGITVNTFTKFADSAGIRGYAPVLVAAKPNPVDDLIASALLKERKGDYRGMLADLERGILLDSQNSRLYYSRGVAKSMLGNKDAIEDYNFAISLNLNDTLVYNNRGVAKAKFGDKKGAILDYKRAIAIDPNYADPYYNYGKIEFELGDKKASLQNLNRAIALDPNFDRAYFSRAAVKSSLGDKKGEIDDLNRAITIDPNYAQAYYKRGLARVATGDKKGAISDYDRAIVLNPKNPEIYNERGDLKSQLGDNKGAIADYSSAIILNPSSARAYANRGSIQSKLGDKKAAILDLKKAANRYKQQKQTASYQKVITEIKRLSS
ncbi:tetratricopeptide repeat protein [Chamaesiphon sp.]|uniref:tetratricopeptide repeat protein n=1 Tax=Chamaesiphon sp. TaxID=2814140 RepID=UPI003593A7BC